MAGHLLELLEQQRTGTRLRSVDLGDLDSLIAIEMREVVFDSYFEVMLFGERMDERRGSASVDEKYLRVLLPRLRTIVIEHI